MRGHIAVQIAKYFPVEKIIEEDAPPVIEEEGEGGECLPFYSNSFYTYPLST